MDEVVVVSDQDAVHEVPTASDAEAHVSVTGLHLELRRAFDERPAHRSLAEGLGCIAEFFGASYGVLHGRIGPQLYSEEWGSEEGIATVDEGLREAVTEAMADALDCDASRCLRLRRGDQELSVFAALLHDDSAEPSGAAAILVPSCQRESAFEILALFEGVVGFLSVLASESSHRAVRLDHSESQAVKARSALVQRSRDPMQVALHIAGHLRNRFGVDQIAIGFVRRDRAELTAICGVDEVRAGNPGVKLAQAAMNECFDRGEPVVHHGAFVSVDDDRIEDDCRLHAQWSKESGGDAVASFPLVYEGDTVAVVSMRHSSPGVLTRDMLARMTEDVAVFGPLVPLASLAGRNLLSHARDTASRSLRWAFGRSWRSTVAVLGAAAFVVWMLFGSVTHTVSVAGHVEPGRWATVPSARGGVLEAVHVRPGDRVVAGELLAELGSEEQLLRWAELLAQIESTAFERDAALAERDPARVRVLQARLGALEAERAIAEWRMRQARIVAPAAGVVVEGDLRPRVGTQLGLGEELFRIAVDGELRLVLDVPEFALRDCEAAGDIEFAPAAHPDAPLAAKGLLVLPTSSVVDGRIVFRGECDFVGDGVDDDLMPGMEGIASIDVGTRTPWWILTRRAREWWHLSGWW